MATSVALSHCAQRMGWSSWGQTKTNIRRQKGIVVTVRSLQSEQGVPGDPGATEIPLSKENEELLRRVGEMFESKQLFRTLRDEFSTQKKSFADLEKSFAHQEVLLRSLVEGRVRDQVARMFGEGYQRPLLALSLQDVALMLPDETVYRSGQVRGVLTGPLKRARRVSAALVEAGIPKLLLKSLQEGVGASGWLRPDGTVDHSAVGRYIDTSCDGALKSTLVRLRRVLLLEGPDAQIKELLLCSGAGIVSLIAAAFPETYLVGDPKAIPSNELKFDCRGRMDIAESGDFAFIDVGEVMTGLDYIASVSQLGLGLGALRWFVVHACGAMFEKVHLVGRLFVLKHGAREELVDAARRDEALKKWGYSLILEHDFL